MDRVSRLIASAFLALFACSVFAATCVPHTETQYRFSIPGSTRADGIQRPTLYTDWDASAASVCSQAAGLNNAEYTYTNTSGKLSTIVAMNSTAAWNGTACQLGGTRTTQSCNSDINPPCGAVNTFAVSGTVSFTTRSVVVDCTADCQTKQGSSVAAAGAAYQINPYTGGSTVAPPSICVNACTAKIGAGGSIAISKTVNGVTSMTVDGGAYTYSGGTCSGNGVGSATTAAPDPCPAGKAPGTIGGTSVCVPVDSTTTVDKKVEAPAGTAASAANGAASAPGAVTTTEVTTCTNGVCRTTRYTSTTGSNGVTQTTGDAGTTEQSQSDYCASHPKADICGGDKSTFTGACSATQCSGDAVMCAIAQEQQKRDCELFDENSGSALGRAAQANGDAGATDHPYRNPTSTSLANMIDKTNILAGSCPADMSVPVGARSVTLPFSQLCTPATWLGNILVGLTALTCIGIVFVRGS